MEFFDVVDKKDNIIGRATRKECHSNKNLIHRSVMILLFNGKGELLLQKRSMKMDMHPGKWTVSSSGHVDAGESYEEAAKRELKEELGIKTVLNPSFKVLFDGKEETEMEMVLTGHSEGPFRPDPEEVDEVSFFGMGKVKNMMKTPAFDLSGSLVIGEYLRRSGKDGTAGNGN